MRRFEKERLQRRSSLREHLPRPSSTSDVPVKLIFILLYVLGAILVWSKQDEFALISETTALLSPVASLVMQHILAVYLLVGGVFLTILILYPHGKKAAQDQLRSIGLVNHTDMVSALKRRYRDKQNPRITVWEFSSHGIPLKTWEDKQAAIETILDITIVKMKYGSGKSSILLYTVPARTDLPEVIDWNDKYLSHKPFILALGESFTGPVTVDLVKVTHILLAASEQPNIDRYNETIGEDLPRYIFACDEIAEVLDKTGLSIDQKEVVRKSAENKEEIRSGRIS